ncbi:hypothetical protein [Shimia sp. MMG029]|uniref:hypothetical protein n=1 Tax=Shimia sp. MMG029 TaxID=3021978 RepID=UPI0022FEDE2D|nr:hypothetical protein [Shimia sp. MMG029]MDA5556179.1 hypothetical protein [Shimia sp. MMG029]
MTAVSWLSLLASSGGFASGSYFLKRYADLGSLADLGCAFAIFALSLPSTVRRGHHSLAWFVRQEFGFARLIQQYAALSLEGVRTLFVCRLLRMCVEVAYGGTPQI